MGNGKIVWLHSLMLQSLDAYLCQSGQRKEYFGLLPTYTEGDYIPRKMLT